MNTDRGFGLYVHWPFCQAKCPYCDFNSHVAASVDHDVWANALVSEIERYAQVTGPRQLDSIFFGGGTPSLMAPKSVARVIDAAQTAWTFSNDIEITLEANPTSVEAARFHGFRSAGINRVSVGLQALNDPDLKALGRLHSAEEGRRAFELARETFGRVSFDLIYARQNQSLADWESELNAALALAADHISLYQLTIEGGTAFGDRFERGLLRGLPDDDLGADMFHLTQDMTEAASMPAYEISNHAKPEAESRHNMIYWSGGDWVGVGPGAHGRLSIDGHRHATKAVDAPSEWLSAVGTKAGSDTREMISLSDHKTERLLMGLRLREGVERDLVKNCDDKVIYINSLAENDLLEADDKYIRTTRAGRPLLNTILKELLT